jgi:predicted branched-subunit amino acid permease
MSDTISPRQAFRNGARDALPFTIVVVPFAILFGVVGTEAGLNLAQVMGFSIGVIAGASQFAALQLMSEDAPTLIVVASALAVNLRMAMYSAALAPHLGPASLRDRALVAYMNVDQTYALSVQRYEMAPAMSTGQGRPSSSEHACRSSRSGMPARSSAWWRERRSRHPGASISSCR